MEKTTKTILALDLSLTCTGYAILKVDEGSIQLLTKGHIKNPSSKVVKKQTIKFPIGVRLNKIATEIAAVAFEYGVDEVVREASFSNSRIRSTQSIFAVNGAVLCRLAMNGWEHMEELAPSAIKKAVAGYGGATKQEVEHNLFQYIGYHKYEKDDESDAVAVGVAYCIKKGYVKSKLDFQEE